MASNGNGVWTAPVSSPPFSIAPSFYQTTWFAILSALVVVLLLGSIFSLRVRALTRAIRARAEERADERIRIARELHDTLLQGVQGLMLTIHVAAEKVSADNDSRGMLEKALSTADRIIIEGRNRVSSLRSEHLADSELIESLQNVGRDLARDDSVRFAVERVGISATLHPHVADEIFYIAREALTNSYRHAQASTISVTLRYGYRHFSIACNDDGRGFDAQDQEKAGHWASEEWPSAQPKSAGDFSVPACPCRGSGFSLRYLPTAPINTIRA